MSDHAIIDYDHFTMMTGGDGALQAELIDLFETQAELWRRLLIPDAPVHTWRDAAHTLKGSARGLGLWGLAEACETAEHVAGCGVREGAAVASALGRVQTRLTEALNALRGMFPKAPAALIA
jgi:chemotaxis protein histidine kinase CheA